MSIWKASLPVGFQPTIVLSFPRALKGGISSKWNIKKREKKISPGNLITKMSAAMTTYTLSPCLIRFTIPTFFFRLLLFFYSEFDWSTFFFYSFLRRYSIVKILFLDHWPPTNFKELWEYVLACAARVDDEWTKHWNGKSKAFRLPTRCVRKVSTQGTTEVYSNNCISTISSSYFSNIIA